MVVWGALVGALLGWIWCDFEQFGLLLGGLPGAIAGLALRSVVRREIAERLAGLQAEVQALRGSSIPPPRPAGPQPQAPTAPPFPSRARTPSPPSVSTNAPVLANAGDQTGAWGMAMPPMFAAALKLAREWLFGGNTVVRVGVVILFIGLAFLASYAASAGLFPIEYRLTVVAMAGVALLGLGFRARDRRPDFALALQGAGVAVIYLTIYAAARWYGLASITPALVLMIAVCALAVALALLQASQSLAVFAFAGGYAAPLLLAIGGGDVAVLFGFYTVLNLGVLALVRREAWRVLGLVGFASTFGMAALWQWTGGPASGADRVAGHAFVIGSVVLYALVALFATRSAGRGGLVGPAIDTTLLFGPAVAGFGMELALLDHRPFASAFAALGFAGFYLALAAFDRRRGGTLAPLMTDALIAIGIGFVTVAVPLALGARWTSAVWALEGAAAVWIGARQARWLPRAFGLLLQGVAAVLYLASLDLVVTSPAPMVTGAVGAIVIAVAAAASARWLSRPLVPAPSAIGRAYDRMERRLAPPLFLIGFSAWCLGCALPLSRFSLGGSAVDLALQPLIAMVAVLVSVWGARRLGRVLDWPVATWPAHGTVVVLATGFAWRLLADRSVVLWPDIAIWAVAGAVHLRCLFESDRRPEPGTERLRRFGHVGTAWLAAAMLVDGLIQATVSGGLRNTGWWHSAPLVALAGVVLVLTRQGLRSDAGGAWPWAGRQRDHGWLAAAPLVAVLLITAVIVAITAPGDAAPLPYLPILNPVDLALALAIAAAWMWRAAVLRVEPPIEGPERVGRPAMLAGLGLVAFVLVSTAWLRVSHQLLGVEWSGSALTGSFVVQAGLAIGWSALALGLMVAAHRRGLRALWIAGAVLLAITVLKLLVIDLGNIGGGARIVTFIGVGVVMLVIGYIAPLPPREPDGAAVEPVAA